MRSEVVFDVDPAHEDPRARGDGPASIDVDGRGRLLVAAGGWAGLLLAETGEILRTLAGFPGRRAEGRYRFFQGGRRIAGFARDRSGEGAIHVWDPEDGSEVDRIAHPDLSPLLDVSPAGFAVSARGPTAWLLVDGERPHWNRDEGARLLGLETPGAVRGAGALFLDDHRALLADGRVWNVSDGRYRETREGPFATFALLPGGLVAARAAVGAPGHRLRILRLEGFTFREEAVFANGSGEPVAGSAEALAIFDRRASWLLRIRDRRALAIATPRAVTGACFSADGRRLFAAGEDGLVRAWKIDLADRYG